MLFGFDLMRFQRWLATNRVRVSLKASDPVKYTPPGGHIEIGLTAAADVIQVTVTDDGIGIP